MALSVLDELAFASARGFRPTSGTQPHTRRGGLLKFWGRPPGEAGHGVSWFSHHRCKTRAMYEFMACWLYCATVLQPWITSACECSTFRGIALGGLRLALKGRRVFSKTSDTWTCPSSTGVCPSWPLQVNKANGRHFLARAAVNGSQMSCTGPIQCSACETMNHFRMNSCQRRETMTLLSYFFDSNRCQLKCQCLVSPSIGSTQHGSLNPRPLPAGSRSHSFGGRGGEVPLFTGNSRAGLTHCDVHPRSERMRSGNFHLCGGRDDVLN